MLLKMRTKLILLTILALMLAACSGPEVPAAQDEPEVAEVETTSEEAMDEEAEEVMDDDAAMEEDEEMMEEDAMEETMATIAEVASEAGSFETLLAALTAAELAPLFADADAGPFTVFAPTDEAFAALPEGTVEALLEDPSGALTDILTYHVVDGKVSAETVVTLDSATTLNGGDVTIAVVDGGVVLNDSVNVVTTDIEASNGIIHVIDAVLMPHSDDMMMDDDEMMDDESMEEDAMMDMGTIAEVATEAGSFNTLLAALTAADLAGTFADADAGPFTVFAPTDEAFAALPEGTVEALLEDPSGALTDILTYHVVEGEVLAETVITLESATTLNGADVSIAVVGNGVVLNDSVNVVTTDIKTSNGVIHVIDAVLLPPTDDMMEDDSMMEEAGTIAEVATEAGSFNTLLAALTAADLAGTFADAEAGPFTVFAPTDDAFAALPEGTVEALLEDPSGALTDILTYHVVEGAVLAETVVTLESAMTLNGKAVTIEVTEDGVVLNGSVNVTATDVKASNGVIHVIDAVLLPPEDDAMMEEESMEEDAMMAEAGTIAEVATEAGSFGTLLAALTAADLAGTFADAEAGPFTVFAPTDEAFAALPEGTVEALLADPSGALTDILTYHVVEGAVLAETVVTLESAMTLNGKAVTIEVTDDGVVLNGSVNVTATDIKASNGVIHVIDAVLLPPEDEAMMEEDSMMADVGTIAEVATEAGTFGTLLTALTEAGLAETFADADAGPFTVFAPTDEAFAALPEGTIEALLADPSGALTTILTYHVVEGAVKAETVVTLDSAITLQGEDVHITIVDGGVVLNDTVNVVVTDIVASNGVIHVIDAVLMPPSMIQ